MSFLPFKISAALLATTGAALAVADPASAVRSETSLLFENSCVNCHDAETRKGGLNLEAVDFAMQGKIQTDLWTRIYDRIASGEMPPADKTRPKAKDVEKALNAIRPQLLKADAARREVVQRRLNRVEYQNTVQELLGVDLELKHLLPEDQKAGGFDNNGEALAMSPDQMQGYLEAARAALQAAIVEGARPQTESFKVNALQEVKAYLEQGTYSLLDDRVVIWVSDNSNYSKISTRSKRVPVRGRYRFEFQAAAYQASDPVAFSVTASTFDAKSPSFTNLGYFEAGPTPQTFTIEAELEAKSAIQFFALGLPTWRSKNKDAPPPKGVGFGEVTVTGPLAEDWPPKRHRDLVGNADLQHGTVADAEGILRRFVPLAFRRPARPGEVERYVRLVEARLKEGRGFVESLKIGLTGVLCSPNFLYLREDAKPSTQGISNYELASRLSYFLWSAPPDETLLALAEAGSLRGKDTLKAEVERLLENAKSEAFVKNFTGQWLRLRQINDTTPDTKLYPNFDELLQKSMVWESEGFFREMLRSNAPLEDFLDSNWAMLNQRLAEHYGIPGVKGLPVRKCNLPAGSVRGGILTQAAVLKVTANGTTTSPVLRGVWVLENILGKPVPPPPPNTAGIEPDIRGATTIREQLAQHRNSESCNACHRNIDPPGFALESFDPTGEYRDNYKRWLVTNAERNWGKLDKGGRVDASGTFAGQAFGGIHDFKRLLKSQPEDFCRCLCEKLLTYGLGRETGFSDREQIEKIVRQTRAEGNGLRSLLKAIASSDIFAAP